MLEAQKVSARNYSAGKLSAIEFGNAYIVGNLHAHLAKMLH